MQITVQLPDDFAERRNPGRDALELLVVEGYRIGEFSHHQAGQLLGMSRIEFDGFLKERQIDFHAYGPDDLEEDRETLRLLQARGLIHS
jgi:predicted HTH domain antitoxin